MIIVLIFILFFGSAASFLLAQGFFGDYLNSDDWDPDALLSMLLASLLFALSGILLIFAVLYSINFMM